MPLLRTLRPKQWAKNVFVFAALVFDHKLADWRFLTVTIAAFVVLCFLSSSVYILNDLADIEKDRQHPKKRNRPIASGALPIPIAYTALAVLAPGSLIAAFALGTTFGYIALAYFVSNVLYSFWLKHVVLVDVMVLASGFLLRAAGGAELIGSVISPWLYICVSLLALFIGFGKRRGELLIAQNGGSTRKVLDHYSLSFVDQLINLVASATIVAYSFYTFSAENLPANHSMMLTIPFVLYALFRYLYLIHIKGEGGAPDELVFVDRPLQLSFALWALSVVLVLYLNPVG
ncbi:MAG TPA: decaprenyl-phosphate phosphoribosyltransferase [Anaerolineales bacterium]|nr:decaprenyl-phosphate phosphoribosyltransferase [Anaerolineales bacterium]HRF48189.1 decaprenyl-phosphate phosphoribosyltransferase [Anaerolineales bacterium]